MQLGALLTRLSDESDAAAALDALGDVVLLARDPGDGRAA